MLTITAIILWATGLLIGAVGFFSLLDLDCISAIAFGVLALVCIQGASVLMQMEDIFPEAVE